MSIGFEPSSPLRRSRFGDVSLAVPSGWCATTEAGQPPTLSLPDGVGALQLSVGIYVSGALPDFSPEALRNLLLDERRELGPPSDLVLESSPRLAAATFHLGNDDARIWYVSDGVNVAMVTYLSEAPLNRAELADAEAMVRSLTFVAGTA